MRKNQEVADMLNEIAALLELDDVKFKPRAYERAAQTIESMSEDIAKKKDLDDIEGVGESIAEKITEFLKTGKCKYVEKLRKKHPINVQELEAIEGIGPKTIKKLYKKFNIKSKGDLEKAAKAGKLRKVKGFGRALEEKALQDITFHKKHKGRMLLHQVLPIAEDIVEGLKQRKEVRKISLAGSLLRRKETIGDVDILVTTKHPKKVIEHFTSIGDIQKVIAKGTTKASIGLKTGLQVDLRVVRPEQWGSALQYFTGSKQHSVELRKIAKKKGYKLSEYGLFKGDKPIATKTEDAIYKKLGMQTPPPEMREAKGEIELAIKKKLPSLVTLDDIKGDFHVHSKHSDGAATILEMARAAKKLKRSYMLQSDHTGQLPIAGGMKGRAIDTYLKDIKKANNKISKFTILKGAEVNITKKGEPDIPNEQLKKFDICIGSIHHGLTGSKAKQTNRICKAMEHKYINIIAHPSGRLLNQRKGYDLNYEEIYEVAKQTKTALEINAQPKRLDLTDNHIRDAIQTGVKLVIATDAHATDHLQFMKYGVATARRGWCEKKHILNCQSASQVKKYFKR